MTDLSEFTADQLAEKVLNAIATAASYANEDGRQLLYSDLHQADGFVTELVRRASERDQAVRERDEARVAFLENPLWIQQVAETRRLRDALEEADSYKAERDQAVTRLREAEKACVLNPCLALATRAEEAEADARRLRDALKEIEVIRMAAAGPNKPLPHSARVEIGQIARSALAAGGGKAAT